MFHLLPVNGRDAGHGVVVADALRQQPVSDLPREHGRVLSLVICDLLHDLRRGHFGFRPSDDARFDAAGFIISVHTDTHTHTHTHTHRDTHTHAHTKGIARVSRFNVLAQRIVHPRQHFSF